MTAIVPVERLDGAAEGHPQATIHADHRRNDMAAHSDSSSDPTPTQSLGSSAAGAHAATGVPAATPDYTPVDRTPTTPASTLPPAGPVSTGTTDVTADTDRHRGMARGERQQVVAAQKERFGGVSWAAAFFGWLSANGMAVILVALLSAGGLAFGLSDNVDSADEAADSATSGIGLGAGIALLVALFLAYLAGGYVAGRMARFDGVKQGIAVWVIGLVVVILLALAGLVFGSQYNVLAELDLPRIPVDEGTATTAGIIALVAVLVATLVGAVLGGSLGARYHRKVDRVGFDAV
jgi:membrane protease YdiL (CAAX protease family)